MPTTYLILFEFIAYLQFAICLLHALKSNISNLLRLLVGAVFGIILELLTIRQFNAYQYMESVIMILDVPLYIGIGWGCIIYSAMEFSNASSLPVLARPILDGLFALNIDLGLDAIAIRLGFWDWGRGLQDQYFGVPYANFWGWFWVVVSFSFGYRLFAYRRDRREKLFAPFAALIVGLIGVIGMDSLIIYVVPLAYRGLVVLFMLISALAILFFLKLRFYQLAVPMVAFWVPFITHSYLLITGLISGALLNPPFLLFIGILMLATALLMHRPSIQMIFTRK